MAACKAPVPSTQARSDREIPLDFTELEARYKGRMGFALARDGVFGQWRGQERFVYCSTFKMYLAAVMLVRARKGLEDLERHVPITRADMLDHAPITEKAVGRSLSLKALMKGTVEVSDNPAANILIREMGGLDVMRQFYRDIGDTTTRVDRLEPEMNRQDGDKDTIQPLQSVRNIERLFLSEASPLDAASQRLLLEWMVASPTGQSRLKASAPAGWTVAHKTGTGGYGPTNDIGILYPVEGAPIVVAAYFRGAPDSTTDGREEAIAEATRMALTALGHG
ncbi:class A beta-lactamase [Brevundimonas vesicularis]|uniref:class A beta-lactamase n=1 Tax=Brevundimonas vesicularis TaxID=41276 RepID=UPI0038D3B0C8